MAKKEKVDVKAVARELIRLTDNKVHSKEISSVLALAGHKLSPSSIAALKAWAFNPSYN